jgi:hypothetical protein
MGDVMVKIEKTTTYFQEPGSENTDDVIKAVSRRVNESLKTVIVASTSGETGLKFAEAFKGKANVIAVSHEKMDHKLKEKIMKLGAVAADETFLPLHEDGMADVKNTFYSLGQGFKVAVEVMLIATERGLVKPYTDVIAVAGSGGGSDTALVVRTTKVKEMLGEDHNKKLEVREVIAMPLKKKWWE